MELAQSQDFSIIVTQNEWSPYLDTGNRRNESCRGKSANRAADEIIEQGVKLPPSVKDAFPTMYHYADADTLATHAVPQADGSWILNAHPTGRYITMEKLLSQDAAKSGLQLPKAGDLSDALTKGRFRCEIITQDIANDIVIPRGWRHSDAAGGFNERDWIESIVLDNPERGLGGIPQMTQKMSVKVEVFDQNTGEKIETLAELLNVDQ